MTFWLPETEAALADVEKRWGNPSMKVPRPTAVLRVASSRVNWRTRPDPNELMSTRSRICQAFLQGWREHGFVEGQNLMVERRYAAGKMDRLHALAAELVQLGVDVIYTWGHGARAARNATTTIPLVAIAMGQAPSRSGGAPGAVWSRVG